MGSSRASRGNEERILRKGKCAGRKCFSEQAVPSHDDSVVWIIDPVRKPAARSGDEGCSFLANTGFNAPCSPPRQEVEDFLTGFTGRKESMP